MMCVLDDERLLLDNSPPKNENRPITLERKNYLKNIMGSLANYFDYEAFARELFMYDYNMGANNNAFRVL